MASGEIRDVEVYSGPLESGDKTLLYSIIHDVTKQRQNHIKLVETNKELEQAVAQIKALSSALEHRVQLRTFELQESNEQLEQKKEEIQKNNIALRVLLDQHQSTREEIEDQVSARLKKLVYPYLDLLRHEVSNELRKEYLAIITSHLDSITEPFTKKLANPLWHLTPREILVADLVKQGKRTKEIGQVLKISPRTAERYRNNIRKKIGITKKKISLSAYLNSLSTST